MLFPVYINRKVNFFTLRIGAVRIENTARADLYCGEEEKGFMDDPIPGGMETPPRIPDFVLVEKCGHGGSGTIYLGIDRDGIRRAVRVLRRDALEPEQLDAEKTAIGCYRNLIHGERNLIDVLYTGETPEALYYVMPLADSLNERWCRYRPATLAARIGDAGFTREAKLETLLTVADALRRIHERGLAHRDLKPENILYIDGEPVIADPGSCAPLAEIADVGTPGYKPPCPCRGDLADIHAFGRIAYTLFSGYPPELYPDIPDDWNGDFHAAVDRLIFRCCGGEAERYRNANELCADLAALAKPGRRRYRALAAGAAVLAVSALIAGILLTVRTLRTSDARTRTAAARPPLLKSGGHSAAMHGGK